MSESSWAPGPKGESPSLHPADWTLELYAEGELSAEEQTETEAHLAKCCRCAQEVDSFRVFLEELNQLPRLAPSPGFNDAVMARVQIAPPPRLEVWMQKWLPTTRRAWALTLGVLSVPAMPVIALVAYVLTQPMVSASSLLAFGGEWIRTHVWGLAVDAMQWLATSRAAESAASALSVVGGLSTVYVTIVLALFAVGTPLALWSLFRLARIPTRGIVHAN
jgi:hypothetical protein